MKDNLFYIIILIVALMLFVLATGMIINVRENIRQKNSYKQGAIDLYKKKISIIEKRYTYEIQTNYELIITTNKGK